MIAVGLIGVAVFLIPQFLSIYNPREQTVGRVCESHAQSVIAAVQEETTHRNLVQWLEDPIKRAGPTRPTFTATRAMPNASNYWNPTASFYTTEAPSAGPATGARLQNAALIQGSLRTLAAIYSQNNSVRCAFAAYDPLTNPINIPLPAALAAYNTPSSPVVTINITPYRISTNAELCPPTSVNLFPVPSASSISEMTNVFTARSGNTNVSDTEASDYPLPRAPTYDDAVMNTYQISNRSNGEADLGFRLRVQVSYVVNGTTKTCQASQNFEYSVDNTPPAVPNDVAIVRNGSLQTAALIASQDNCSGTISSKPVTLRIGYTTAPERGTVLLCRDLSYTQNRESNYIDDVITPFNNPSGPTSSTTHYSGACIGQAGIALGTRPPATNGLNPFPRQRSTENPAYDPEENNPSTSRLWDQAYRSFALRENFWQPCDKLKLCGVSPTTVTLTNEISMTLEYTSVSIGCVVNFEVVGVDTAGNRSNSAVPPVAPARPHRGVIPTLGISEGNIMFPPTCGNSTSCGSGSCGSQTKANYSQYYFGGATDNGYYVPRRGVFCKATKDLPNDGDLSAVLAEPNATLHWSTNTVGGANWRTIFPNGYYTCREAFGGTGGAGGSGSSGCCWDPPGATTCTPYN